MKLLCFFFYFSSGAIFSFILLVIGFQNSIQDMQLFFEYYSCEAYGMDPADPCVLKVDRRKDQTLIILSNLNLLLFIYFLWQLLSLECVAVDDF